MIYKATKIDGQNLMYCIETQHNGANINFNVVCADNDTEIESLVQHHINFLDNRLLSQPSQPSQQLDTMALIANLKIELEEMKSKVAALESGNN